MAALFEYKCPCCGGAIAFSPELQKLKCPYCDTEFEPETLKNYDEILRQDKASEPAWDTAAGGEWAEDEAERLCTYVCRSCGGEIVTDQTTAAASCPYCGNPIVVAGQLSGMLKPDLVLPFRLDRNAAVERLKQHLQKKRLLPKVFREQNHIDEVKGVYVPFWLFDADADAHMVYKATRIRAWHDNRYDYTETSHYAVRRGGTVSFEQVPVDGSSKMPDDLMESLEPFDLKDAVDFQTAFLAGYFADRYDVDAQHCVSRANERIRFSTEQLIAQTVTGYASVIPQSQAVSVLNGHTKYALLPVWLLNTSWNGQNFQFAMNGQTGKFVGNLPLDRCARNRWLFGLWGAVSAGLSLLGFLAWLLF